MRRVQIIHATVAHAKALGRTLRDADRCEGERLGLTPEMAVCDSLVVSLVCRAALVDGEVAAMWGLTGNPLGSTGAPWLLTAPPCRAISALRFARIYFHEARGMLAIFPRLENYVDAQYLGAVRLLRLAGFSLDAPAPFGRRGEMFRRFVMVA